jgi:hypothetical protein
VFGYKPPARLDFAYCKMSFLNSAKIPEASETIAATEHLKTVENGGSSELLLEHKIQELNLLEGKLGALEESDEDDEVIKNENPNKNDDKEGQESSIDQPKTTRDNGQPTATPVKEESANKLLGESGGEGTTPKLMNFLVIHGGMDTEGNVYDDCFFIHLLD